MSGTPLAKLNDLAYVRPTSSEPTNPGPTVAAMASSSPSRVRAVCNASRTTGTMARRCSREASSGTTPPYLLWAICEATTEDSTVSAFSTTAAAVSSQEDSIPRRSEEHTSELQSQSN